MGIGVRGDQGSQLFCHGKVEQQGKKAEEIQGMVSGCLRWQKNRSHPEVGRSRICHWRVLRKKRELKQQSNY